MNKSVRNKEYVQTILSYTVSTVMAGVFYEWVHRKIETDIREENKGKEPQEIVSRKRGGAKS